MASKYLKRYVIPEGFENLIMEFTKEVLRNQPDDVIDFSCEYFKCLQEGLILDYDKKGENLPCDFTTIIPKLTSDKTDTSIAKEAKERYQKALEKARNTTKLKNISQDEYIRGETPIEDDHKEKEKTNFQKELEIQKSIEIKKDITKEKEKQKEEEPSKITKEEKGKIIKEYHKLKEEEEKSSENNSFKVYIKTTENDQKDDDKETFGNKLDLIDFDLKETLLNELKPKNEEEIEKYINEVFIPNKKYTDLIVKIQKAIKHYYDNHSNSLFNQEEFKSVYDTIINAINNSLLDITSLINTIKTKSLKESNEQFKSMSFYPQLLMCYVIKAMILYENNSALNQHLDDFCFFCLNPILKNLLEVSARKVSKYPWIVPFFSQTALYLQFDLYSLYQTRSDNPLDEKYIAYTSFSIKKRELYINIYLILSLDIPKREKEKELEIYQRWYYNSSLEQINVKFQSLKGICPDEDIDGFNSKLERASSKIWTLLKGILDMPIDILDEFIFLYQQLEYFEQDIIMNYLAIREDYNVIYDKFKSIPRATEDNKHLKQIKQLYHYLNTQSMNEVELSIIKDKLAIAENMIHDEIKSVLNQIRESNKSTEGIIVKRFSRLSKVRRDLTFTILINKEKNEAKYERIIDKIKLVQAVSSIDSYIKRVTFLNEYFSKDANEYLSFINEVNQWKEAFPKKLFGFFEKDKQDQLKLFKHNLSQEEKKFVVKMHQLIMLINEETDEDLAKLIEDIAKINVNKTTEEKIAMKKEKIIKKNKTSNQCRIGITLGLINYIENESDDNKRLLQFSLLNKKEKELVIETLKYRLGEEIEQKYIADLNAKLNDEVIQEDFYKEVKEIIIQLTNMIESKTINDEDFNKATIELSKYAPEADYIITEITSKKDINKDILINVFLSFIPCVKQLTLTVLKYFDIEGKYDNIKQWIDDLTPLEGEAFIQTQLELINKLTNDLASQQCFNDLWKYTPINIRFLYNFISSYPSTEQELEYARKLFSFLTVNERKNLIMLLNSELTHSTDDDLTVFVTELNNHMKEEVVQIDYYNLLLISFSLWVSLTSIKDMKKYIMIAYREYKTNHKGLFDYFNKVLSDTNSSEIDKACSEIKIFVDQVLVLDSLLE